MPANSSANLRQHAARGNGSRLCQHPGHRGPRFLSSAGRGHERALGLPELSSPGTPRSDWAAGANAGRHFAGCDVGSATGTRLRKVSPGTGCCSAHLQLDGGRKGRSQWAAPSKCLPAFEASSTNARVRNKALTASQPCRVKPKGVSARTAGWEPTPEQSSQQIAQWHHKPGTGRQVFKHAPPSPFLFSHKEGILAISLKKQTASSECSFSLEDSFLQSSGCRVTDSSKQHVFRFCEQM